MGNNFLVGQLGKREKSERNWNMKRMGLAVLIIILVVGGISAYFLVRSGGGGKVTENEFLNDVQNFSNQMVSVGSGVTEIRIPENSMVKFENQSAIAITGGKTHSYNTNRELVIEPELETGIGPGEYQLSYTKLKNDGMKVMTFGKNESVSTSDYKIEWAEFEVSNLSLSSSKVGPNEPVNVSVDVSNIGEKSGEYNVKLKVDGTTENTQTISLNGGEETTVTFTLQRETKKSYSVEVDSLSDSFEVLAPAEFELSNFTLNPKEPVVGEDFTASVDVKNIGETEGTYKAVWKVEGETDDTHTITLGSGKSKTVNFSMVWENVGTYNVSIGKLSKNIEIEPAIEFVKKRRFDTTQTWISGIIKNNSSRNLLPKIKVKYYQDDKLVYETSGSEYPTRAPLKPGMKFPFKTDQISHEGVQITDYRISVSYGVVLGWENRKNVFISDHYVSGDLTPSERDPERTGEFEVETSVKNDSGEIIERVLLGAVFYNEEGEFVGVDRETMVDVPPVGTHQAYLRAYYYDLQNRPIDYDLFISAWSEN